MEFYSNGLNTANNFWHFKNITSGSSAFGGWIDIGSNSAYGLYLTTHGNNSNGALWIDPDNGGGGQVASTSPLLRVTNKFVSSATDERFRVFGDGSVRFNTANGEVARLFGATGNFAINTNGVDGGEKFQVSGSIALDLGSDATGDIYYRNSSGATTRLGPGSNGDVLTIASGLPAWQAPSSSTTLYTGDGTVSGNRNVNLNNLNLTFSDVNTYQINQDVFALAKADGTFGYIVQL